MQTDEKKPVFSPSFTKAYDFCPIKARLERTLGLAPAIADRGLYARIAGSAFHAGAAKIHTYLSYNTMVPNCILEAQSIAKLVYESQFKAFREAGGAILESDYQKALDSVTKTLAKYAKETPVKNWARIRGIEQEFPEHGNCRLDLWGDDEQGIPVIVDLKFLLQLDTWRVPQRLNDYAYDWALSHYAWAAFEEGIIGTVGILLVVGAPFTIQYKWWSVPDMKKWLSMAQAKWDRMEATKDIPLNQLEQPTTHANQYGTCWLKRWCLDMKMEGSLPTDIIQVKWPRHEEVE